LRNRERITPKPPPEPTVRFVVTIRHPDGSVASEGDHSGDELYEADNFLGPGSFGSKYDLAEKLRALATMFARHERPENINANVFVLIRRRPRPEPRSSAPKKGRR
jgi:hypothetical protein